MCSTCGSLWLGILSFLGVIGIYLCLGSCFSYLCPISVCFLGRGCINPKNGAVIINMLLFCELLGFNCIWNHASRICAELWWVL